MKQLCHAVCLLLVTALAFDHCWAFQPPRAVPVAKSTLFAVRNNPNQGEDDERSPSSSSSSLILSHPKEVPAPRGSSLPSRSQQIRNLSSKSSSETSPYDILVVGGGAVGTGIALDAAARGLKVACIERGDFASETSSRSTKLVWAGLKYLATAFADVLSWDRWAKDPAATWTHFVQEFQMVLHCHEERRFMTQQQRHLVYWLPIAVPFESWIKKPAPFGQPLFALFPLFAPFVFKFYDAMSGFSCPPSYIMTKDMARTKFPQLVDDLKYSVVFYEGHHNDARTNLAIALTAAQKGAHVANYIEMVDLIHDDYGHKVVGATCIDRLSGDVFDVRANKVVLAGGPFTDQLRKKEINSKNSNDNNHNRAERRYNTTNFFAYPKQQVSNSTNTPVEQQPFQTAVKAAFGTHIVVPGHFIPPDMGLLDYYTSDGRFLFIAPWQGHCLIGTTDQKGKAESLHSPPEEDITWLVTEAQKYLRKDKPIQRSDVLSAWRGWRPLASDPHQKSGEGKGGDGQGQISRDHVVSENPDTGVVFVAGGKWTTWREMAQDVVDHIVRPNGPPCTTNQITLYGGGEGYSEDLPMQLAQEFGLEENVARHLAGTYGVFSWEVGEIYRTRNNQRLVDGFPYLQAEVLYACQEYACTIEDVLSRRTRLAYLNKEKAIEALPTVAELMATELGWSSAALQNQLNFARLYINSFGGKEPARKEQPIKAMNLTSRG